VNVFGERGQEWHSKLKMHGHLFQWVFIVLLIELHLVIQSWGDLILIARIESFMFNMYDYFNHLLKQNLLKFLEIGLNRGNESKQKFEKCEEQMHVYIKASEEDHGKMLSFAYKDTN
jgi:hypothetical protein